MKKVSLSDLSVSDLDQSSIGHSTPHSSTKNDINTMERVKRIQKDNSIQN